MSGIKDRATVYPRIQCLISMHAIREVKIGPTRNAHEMNDLFKSYKHQYLVVAKCMVKYVFSSVDNFEPLYENFGID